MNTHALKQPAQADSGLTKELAVKIETANGKTQSGKAILQEFDQKFRIKRALKSTGICWGFALASVLIPLAHFILVPSFFLAGFIIGPILYSQERMIMGGSGTCPECQRSFSIVKSHVKWPLGDLCSSCHTAVKIHLVFEG